MALHTRSNKRADSPTNAKAYENEGFIAMYRNSGEEPELEPAAATTGAIEDALPAAETAEEAKVASPAFEKTREMTQEMLAGGRRPVVDRETIGPQGGYAFRNGHSSNGAGKPDASGVHSSPNAAKPDNGSRDQNDQERGLTVLPADDRRRVQVSIEKNDFQFAHLYASLEWKLHEKIDTALTGAFLSDAFSGTNADANPGFAAPSVFGVTSALIGEGKTTIAMHLAFTIARNTFKKVCLIDMSLGADEICRRIGVTPEAGVVSVLEGGETIIRTIQVTDCGDLSIMPGGPMPANSTRAARSPAVPEVIAAARQMFDVVIVDMPAVLTGNALPIAAHLDRVLMVVTAGVTPKDVINDALDRVGRKRTLGVVLNRIKPSAPNWLQRRLSQI
jgi:Mrp family chromosome partitioning ATPase